MHHREHFIDALLFFGIGHAAYLKSVGDIFSHAHVGKQSIALEHHADAALLDWQRGHILCAKKYPTAGVRLFEASNDAQHRRLAAAGGSEQDHGFAGLNVELHRLESTGAVGERFCASFESNTDGTIHALLAVVCPARSSTAWRPATARSWRGRSGYTPSRSRGASRHSCRPGPPAASW